MTKFTSWTLVWFGLGIVGNAIGYHYAGGFDQYRAHYPIEVIQIARAVSLFLWLFLWHTVVRHEK